MDSRILKAVMSVIATLFVFGLFTAASCGYFIGAGCDKIPAIRVEWPYGGK